MRGVRIFLKVGACFFALTQSAQAADLVSVEAQLVVSNDLGSLYSCVLATEFMRQSLARQGTETDEQIAAVAEINNSFGDAFEAKMEAVGDVDISKFIPDWLQKSKSGEEMVDGTVSEFKYCLALHKIAVLERQVKYLSEAQK